MSSVRKRNQTPHKFTTLDIILDMYDYTSQIISNDKVFDRTYKSLIDRIDNEASMIYHLCRTDLVNECLKAIKGWRAAEAREYKSNYGL